MKETTLLVAFPLMFLLGLLAGHSGQTPDPSIRETIEQAVLEKKCILWTLGNGEVTRITADCSSTPKI
jgi:hypothetical protein